MSDSNSFQLGLESLKSGKVDKAVEYLEQATSEFADDYRVFNFLGVAYAQKGNYDRAVGALLTACHLQPNVASIHYNLGLAYQADGFRDKAKEEFEQSLVIDPTYKKAEDAIMALSFQDDASAEDLKLQSCGRHVDEPAVAICSFCRLPVCKACKNVVTGRVFCPKCVQQVAATAVDQ